MAQHILIVEDDEMVQSFLAMHLKNDGFEVSSAGSGKEMSRALGQAEIDLIILDLGLPDGDGLTLAQEVRSRSSIPIIVATARQGADDRIMALGLGADDYVTNPMIRVSLCCAFATFLAMPRPALPRRHPVEPAFRRLVESATARCFLASRLRGEAEAVTAAMQGETAVAAMLKNGGDIARLRLWSFPCWH